MLNFKFKIFTKHLFRYLSSIFKIVFLSFCVIFIRCSSPKTFLPNKIQFLFFGIWFSFEYQFVILSLSILSHLRLSLTTLVIHVILIIQFTLMLSCDHENNWAYLRRLHKRSPSILLYKYSIVFHRIPHKQFDICLDIEWKDLCLGSICFYIECLFDVTLQTFFYLGSHYFFGTHLHRNPCALRYYQLKPRFHKSGYDFISHQKSEWALPQNEGYVMVLILLGQMKWLMDVRVWLLHDFPEKKC